MVSSQHEVRRFSDQVSSGIPKFDELLGGGLSLGTSNLFLGPAGTGKSTLSVQFAYAAAERGENAAIFVFEESINTLLGRASAIGMDLEKHVLSGRIHLQQIDPAELSPGEFADRIRCLVIEKKIRVLAIDSLNGYLHSMPQEQFLLLQLHELLSYLGNQGVVTILVLAQSGLMGQMHTPIDLTYLADTVVITRYFEALGAVRKAVSVIKKRSGGHEPTIREFSISSEGLMFGEPLADFQGVLTGVPEFHGKHMNLDSEIDDSSAGE
jgi:circadian clock protein KaiC